MRLPLSIKAALMGAFGCFALIAAGQGALSLIKLRDIRHAVHEVATNWLPSVVILDAIRTDVADVRIKQFRLVSLSDTPEQHAANAAQYAAARAKVAADRKIYEPMIASPEEQALYDGFATLWTAYEASGSEAARLVSAGRASEGLALIGSRDELALYTRMGETLARDADLNSRSAQQEAETALTLADSAVLATEAAVLLAVAAALAASVFGFLRISRPIQRMTAAMAVLAGGDAGAEVPFRDRRDEVGAMAAAVQVFKDNLLRSRALEAETALARASAEAQRRAGMQQMADQFEAAVGGIVGQVSASATELQATAGAMSSMASQTSAQSIAVAAAAEEASSNVNTVAAAAEELGSSVQEIGRQVDGSTRLAQAAVGEADQTGALVQELNSAVSRIGDPVPGASTRSTLPRYRSGTGARIRRCGSRAARVLLLGVKQVRLGGKGI
ncbi:methyl-accepting chemotaxis protein, partial [Methylobacterium sp. J-026]|uniref:MCP four helix bundle domain-containing protein n=1 Tax=Methylobacterium sp. J-026 TaxID=2836624 RepID=UPI001FB87504